MVKLKEIVDQSKAELLIALSARAAARLTALPLFKLSKRLESLGGRTIEPALEKRLCELIAARNCIVHENAREEISSGIVSAMFDDLESLARFYGELAAENGVRVRWHATEA